MKAFAKVLGMFLLGIVITTSRVNAGPSGGAEAFEQLKALAGHWEANPTADMKATLNIEVTSGGSVVLEKLHVVDKGQAEDMVTAYYLDGDQVKLTHYCTAGNQPTMRGTYAPETKTLTFDFVSATNLKSPNAGHMHRAVYTFLDDDHFKTAWTFRKDQKDAFTEDVTYLRAK
jgi:hypothetical protein